MISLLPQRPDEVPPFGLFIGGCVERGVGSSFRAQAHAHDDPTDPHHLWICVRSYRRLVLQHRHGWSQLMLHEMAHLAAPGGHHDRWRAAARTLGYRVPMRYQPNRGRGTGRVKNPVPAKSRMANAAARLASDDTPLPIAMPQSGELVEFGGKFYRVDEVMLSGSMRATNLETGHWQRFTPAEVRVWDQRGRR